MLPPQTLRHRRIVPFSSPILSLTASLSKKTGNGPAPFIAFGVKKTNPQLSGSKFPMEPVIIIIAILIYLFSILKINQHIKS